MGPLQIRKAKSMDGILDLPSINSIESIPVPVANRLQQTLINDIIGKEGMILNGMVRENGGTVKEFNTATGEYQYELSIDTPRVVYVTSGAAGDIVGENGQAFDIVLDSNLHRAGESLQTNSQKEMFLLSDPVPVAGGYKYQARSASEEYGLPGSDVKVGAGFVSMGKTAGEFSQSGSRLSRQTKDLFHNYVTTIRKETTVSTWANDMPYVIGYKNKDGESVGVSWIRNEQVELIRQAMIEAEYKTIWGTMKDPRKTSLYDPESKTPLTEGAGLYQQIPADNYVEFSSLDYKTLFDYTSNLAYRVTPTGSGVTMIGMTGPGGLEYTSEVIKSQVRTDLIEVTDRSVFEGTGIDMTYGYGFKAYKTRTGNKVIFLQHPLMSLPHLNRELTAQGMPKQGFRINFFGLAPNNQATFVSAYRGGHKLRSLSIEGALGYDGKVKTGFAPAASSVDGCMLHVLYSCGISAANPQALGSLVPSANFGN